MRRETALFALCGLLNLAFLRAELFANGFGESCDGNNCTPGLSCTNRTCLCRETEYNVDTKCAKNFITWKLTSQETLLKVTYKIQSKSVIMATIKVSEANHTKHLPSKPQLDGVLIENLQPGTGYNATLLFNNTLSKNNTSFDLAAYAYTLPAKPENITEADYSNGTLEVTWDQNGDMDRAECRLLGSDEKPIVSDYRCSWTFGPKDIVRVHGVNVIAFNGWENKSGDSYQFNTPYEYVPEYIQNVIQNATVTSVSSTSANITVVERSDAGDDVAAYVINDGKMCFIFQRTTSCEKPEPPRCRPPGEAVLMAKRPEADDDNTTTVVLVTDNLRPSSNYTFTVMPLLCNVTTKATNKKLEQFTTLFEVTNLTATAKGRRVWVDWDSPQAPADVNYTVYIEDRVHVTPENNCSFKDERKIVLCRFGNGTHGNCSGDAPNGFWEYDVTVEANTNKVTSNVTTGITGKTALFSSKSVI
ncbi:hypothetical protein V1264_015008 [Littorina saxatilis]|uniref:Uncharacterized protein n=1 Tax=Littorina saxatilis TaxID=31220 RepID=A0AAN9BP63_9CAEN